MTGNESRSFESICDLAFHKDFRQSSLFPETVGVSLSVANVCQNMFSASTCAFFPSVLSASFFCDTRALPRAGNMDRLLTFQSSVFVVALHLMSFIWIRNALWLLWDECVTVANSQNLCEIVCMISAAFRVALKLKGLANTCTFVR